LEALVASGNAKAAELVTSPAALGRA